ncbi:MAG: hypothetical protein AAFX94_14075 [Myxococcota bacterium]
MPVLFNVIAHFTLGSVLATTARRSTRFRQELVSWPLILLVAFHAVLAAPSATFLFRFYPQWSLLYAFDPQVFPALERWLAPMSGGVVLTNLTLGILGLLVSREGLVRGSVVLERLPLVIATLGAVAGAVFYGERILWVGSYDAYWQDQALFIGLTPAGWVGLATYLAGITFVVWIRSRFADHEPSYI